MRAAFAVLTFVALAIPTSAAASPPTSVPHLDPPALRLALLARVSNGTAIATRAGDPTIYVALQPGIVVAVRGRRVLDSPVLDIRDRVAGEREQGLLGLVFSPDGARLYVHFTQADNAVVVEEYAVRAPTRSGPVDIDVATRRTLLEIPKPDDQHNGGQLAFGPDGMLYVAVGDGGGHRDSGPGHAPEGNGQSLATPLGKILRIDPTPEAGGPYRIPHGNPYPAGPVPEIFVSGLRNPWRFSFDRVTGDLWIGDVGQDHWEEVNFAPARHASGANFGWSLLEGTHAMRATTAPGSVLPVWQLWHRAGYCAIAGGYVYRGRAIPALQGLYVYGDYCAGTVRALRVRGGAVVEQGSLQLRAPQLASFGEDTRGELYVLSQRRGLFRIDPR